MEQSKELLKKICRLIYKLVVLPQSDWKTKIYGNVFLAYLINPSDVVPDHEKEGFVDDLYIGLIILRDLNKYRSELIKKLNVDKEIIESLDNNIKKISSSLGEKTQIIEDYSGYSTLKYFDLANEKTNDKTQNHLKIKLKLLGAITYFFDALTEKHKKSNNQDHKIICALQPITEIGEYFEIKRIMSHRENNEIWKERIKSIDLIDEVFFNYEHYLEKISEKDKYPEILQFLPEIFSILCELYKNPDCSWEIKHEINSALAYLAIWEDIIDDSEEEGMLDDLFILAFVLLDVYHFNKSLVTPHMKKVNIEILFDIIEKIEIITNDQLGEFLNYLGLRGLLEFYDLKDKAENKHRNLETNILILQNNRLKRILLNLARIYFGEDFDVDGKISVIELINEIKSLLGTSDQELFEKFIKLSNELSFIENVEERLEKEQDEDLKILLLKYEVLGRL